MRALRPPRCRRSKSLGYLPEFCNAEDFGLVPLEDEGRRSPRAFGDLPSGMAFSGLILRMRNHHVWDRGSKGSLLERFGSAPARRMGRDQ